jgi:hypothetical protein
MPSCRAGQAPAVDQGVRLSDCRYQAPIIADRQIVPGKEDLQ